MWPVKQVRDSRFSIEIGETSHLGYTNFAECKCIETSKCVYGGRKIANERSLTIEALENRNGLNKDNAVVMLQTFLKC